MAPAEKVVRKFDTPRKTPDSALAVTATSNRSLRGYNNVSNQNFYRAGVHLRSCRIRSRPTLQTRSAESTVLTTKPTPESRPDTTCVCCSSGSTREPTAAKSAGKVLQAKFTLVAVDDQRSGT